MFYETTTEYKYVVQAMLKVLHAAIKEKREINFIFQRVDLYIDAKNNVTSFDENTRRYLRYLGEYPFDVGDKLDQMAVGILQGELQMKAMQQQARMQLQEQIKGLKL